MNLPMSWIDKIFHRLLGVYGAQFKAKFSVVENGVDVGLMNAKEVWSEELATFVGFPESIAYALKNLPSERAPNAIEFRELCRRAPRKEVPAIEYKPTTEDHERAIKAAESAVAALKPKLSDGIDKHWATHPRTQMHLDFIFGAAKADARFRPCIEKMVADGICTADGKLLKTYRAGEFA